MNKKRYEQLKETWIKNVMKNLNMDRETSEGLYNKIKPYGEMLEVDPLEELQSDNTDTTGDS